MAYCRIDYFATCGFSYVSNRIIKNEFSAILKIMLVTK